MPRGYHSGCPEVVIHALPTGDPGTWAGQSPPTKIKLHDAAVIMSHSCDLELRESPIRGRYCKIENVVLCPAPTLKRIEKKNNRKMLGELEKGFTYGFHLLPMAPDEAFFGGGYLVADFNQAFALPIGIVLAFISDLDKSLGKSSAYRKALTPDVNRRLRLDALSQQALSYAIHQFFHRKP